MDPVGTWVEIQTALLEVRLVGSVNDKIILLVSAKPNHKNLGLINHKKNHMQIGIKLKIKPGGPGACSGKFVI